MTARAMTRTEMRKLAQESTSYGYYDHGATMSVKCPLCKGDVVANYSMWTRDDKGKRMTKVAQLRAAMLDHLADEHQTIGGGELKMIDCPCGYRAGSRPVQIGCGAKDCPFRQSGDENG